MNEQDNGLVKDEETGLMLDKETGIYYEEKEDGMYYPLIERKEYWIGKYGDMAMNYMKETQPDRYIKLTIEDKLLERCINETIIRGASIEWSRINNDIISRKITIRDDSRRNSNEWDSVSAKVIKKLYIVA